MWNVCGLWDWAGNLIHCNEIAIPQPSLRPSLNNESTLASSGWTTAPSLTQPTPFFHLQEPFFGCLGFFCFFCTGWEIAGTVVLSVLRTSLSSSISSSSLNSQADPLFSLCTVRWTSPCTNPRCPFHFHTDCLKHAEYVYAEIFDVFSDCGVTLAVVWTHS